MRRRKIDSLSLVRLYDLFCYILTFVRPVQFIHITYIPKKGIATMSTRALHPIYELPSVYVICKLMKRTCIDMCIRMSQFSPWGGSSLGFPSGYILHFHYWPMSNQFSKNKLSCPPIYRLRGSTVQDVVYLHRRVASPLFHYTAPLNRRCSNHNRNN